MNSDYFVVNPSKAPVRERGANVGREHDAIVSSLNQAMEQLGDVERQFLLDSELSLDRAVAVIHLLAEVGRSRCRSTAAMKVAEFFCRARTKCTGAFRFGNGIDQEIGGP
jgi:hypothetical protein